MRSGQILILVLLVVVVALAVGLSVASRNITNLRTSTQTEQSQRAFTAAEAGIEDVLSRIKTVPIGDPQTITVYPNSDLNKEIKATVTVTTSNVYNSAGKIPLGDVAQIDVSSAPANASINVSWAKIASLDSSESPAAVVEVVVVRETSPGVFTQDRTLLKSTSDTSTQGGTAIACGGTTEYQCSTTIPLGAASPRIVRIKPFWNDTSVKVEGSGFTLSPQTYNITSVASTETGVTRKVNVTRTVRQLPAAFDYVLYSENDITK